MNKAHGTGLQVTFLHSTFPQHESYKEFKGLGLFFSFKLKLCFKGIELHSLSHIQNEHPKAEAKMPVVVMQPPAK